MVFGEYLKLLRLELEISLRRLSQMTGIDVAYLSRIETGAAKPPQKEEILEKIINVLKLSQDQALKLNDLASIGNNELPEDIALDAVNNEAIPILLRTINNKRLTVEQIKALAERIKEEY